MSKQTRKLGAALALGFAGGVAAPLVIYVALLHLGGPARAETRPAQQLRLEMEPSTPPAVPVVSESAVVTPAPVAKPAHRQVRRAPAPAEPSEEVSVPRATQVDLGRHIPTAPEAPQ
jgi:hypothetical protein